ncbi:2,4-dienoyl-CoA reductase-like NADH-dependent reductase (Old Yellow Enzyme family) [Rhodanobacter sp. ANJX3]|uniref:NADH:flavin oxidoreductase/NADH oxidase n=1 Tax=Rhodanobacter sp. ANJX3 TaxID=2723083 RepID=UPI00160FFB3D|nr:NADH:flavin oxidoreductase/NADH oxidase [Rhodanobacter sp. ANJX3]MBB5358439.1 2,4-dienoyl-CoA reductase-like NADH-dependent reductase (Old Yellow Enzyme family) [Rhodanobacter sp. ANJX3]
MNLFDPFAQRSLTLPNRLVVSPMCQYSATDGLPDHWHLVHLGSRAVGGAALVITEASAVSAQGRITHGDAGLWNDAQVKAWKPIVQFVRASGAIAGMQLAHAGRKASAQRPWEGGGSLAADQQPWTTVAPSAIPFDAGWHTPQALDEAGIEQVVADFRATAQRALAAGFQLIELHAAHGYLLHQFLSPLSNQRTDRYGGSFENRSRIVREVITAVRDVWPAELPLWLRISATDWAEHGTGWDIDESVQLVKQVKPLGVDLIDVSSGGTLAHPKIPLGPGYQVPFAARIRREAEIATGAVGLITEAQQAQAIIANGEADVVLTARESLRDPYFPRRAAKELGVKLTPPVQYGRAW